MADTASNLLSALNAHIDERVDTLLADYFARQITHTLQIADLQARLAALESKPVPTPKPRKGLYVADGRIMEDGQPFRDLSVTLAAYFFRSSIDAIDAELGRLASLGYRIVRLHHWALNQWGRYVPTYADCEAALPRLEEVIRLCEKHGLYVWLTCQHQQRVERGQFPEMDEALFAAGRTDPAKGDAGIAQGEVHDLHFWNDSLLSHVESFIVGLVQRFPNVAMITLWNEKFAARSAGQWIGDRNKQSLSAYQRAYFQRFAQYEFEYTANMGVAPDTQKPGMLEFQCYVGCKAADRVIRAVREAGYKGIISVSETYGVDPANMATLLEQSRGDVVGFHLYKEKDAPDPFIENDYRTFQTVSNALRLKGYPLVCGEAGAVNQSNNQPSESWGGVARCVAEQSDWLSLGMLYAGHSSAVPGGKADVYSYLKHELGVKDLEIARKLFALDTNLEPEYRQLTREELFGVKPKGKDYIPPPIPGTQQFAKECGGVILPEFEWMK